MCVCVYVCVRERERDIYIEGLYIMYIHDD